jgi:hypothetical protein
LRLFASARAAVRREFVAAALVVVGLGAALPGVSLGQETTGPAVDGVNGKFSVEGGDTNEDGSALGLGSLSVPLTDRFGAQFDGALGFKDDEVLGGAGLHLFMRDPQRYLLGGYGSYHTWNGIDVWRGAGEFELYMGPWAFEGLGGVEMLDFPSTVNGLPVLNDDDPHLFGQAHLALYPTENLRFSAGIDYLNEKALAAGEAEYMFRGLGAPMSLFANGRVGEDDYREVRGGVRIYLGAKPDKSLRNRHRTQDPPNYVPTFPDLILGASTPTNICTSESQFNCDDNNVCTIDQCLEGECANTQISCNDNNACTMDSCNAEVGCTYVVISCDDSNVETNDFCDPQSGCFHTPTDS